MLVAAAAPAAIAYWIRYRSRQTSYLDCQTLFNAASPTNPLIPKYWDGVDCIPATSCKGSVGEVGFAPEYGESRVWNIGFGMVTACSFLQVIREKVCPRVLEIFLGVWGGPYHKNEGSTQPHFECLSYILKNPPDIDN